MQTTKQVKGNFPITLDIFVILCYNKEQAYYCIVYFWQKEEQREDNGKRR